MKTISLACALLLTGCGALRPTANRGHDLLENPGRSAGIRFPAGLGALLGHGLALPVTVVLLPVHPFTDATVLTAEGYGKNREVADIHIPLALGPQEYGSGIGAAVLGMPFEWIARPFRAGPVGMPPGALEEEPELPPGVEDPQLSFAVSPPPPLPAAPAAPAAEPGNLTDAGEAPGRRRVRWWLGAAAAALLVAGTAVLLFTRPGQELLGAWSVASLREAFLRWGAWAWLASTGLMIVQAIASPLPAFVVTVANGYVFGPFWGGVLALFSATLAAQLCFEIARGLGRPVVERWVGVAALATADRFFTRHGVWAVLVARLLPFVPFDPISYAAGLTTTTRARFLAANLVGQIPATFIYSTLGSQLEDGRLPPGVLAGLLAAAGLILTVAVVRARWLASRGA